jgi:hypothetical protein
MFAYELLGGMKGVVLCYLYRHYISLATKYGRETHSLHYIHVHLHDREASYIETVSDK